MPTPGGAATAQPVDVQEATRVKGIRTAWRWAALAACSLLPACVGPPLELGPAELPNAVEGSAYSALLESADGAPSAWQVVDGALPGGLSLAPQAGELRGTPTTPGTFEFRVRASTFGLPTRSGEQDYTLTVIERLTVSAALPPARAGEPYDDPLGIAGGVPPYHVRLAGLPAGLEYDPASGRISGTPLFDYEGLVLTYEVHDSGEPVQRSTGQTTLVVDPRAVAITTTTLPPASAGVPYFAALTATDGRPPYTWRVESGVLPDGLRLVRASGVISGTPTDAARTRTFVILVEDSDTPPTTDEVELVLEVNR